jgi:flagellar hook-associated protein 1 FlgK
VIPASYYGQDLQLNFTSSTSYTVSVAGNTTPAIASGTLGSNGGNIAIAYPSSDAASGQYWQLPITGTPASGDTLTLTPGDSSSGSNAQRMATLWSTPSTTTAGALEQAFVGLSTGLGANASAAQNLATATSTQVSTATTNLQTVAGVNTDQQAVILTNYQQAYQAAAQVISAARTMFDSLLQSV